MRKGIPLDPSDRERWLHILANHMVSTLEALGSKDLIDHTIMNDVDSQGDGRTDQQGLQIPRKKSEDDTTKEIDGDNTERKAMLKDASSNTKDNDAKTSESSTEILPILESIYKGQHSDSMKEQLLSNYLGVTGIKPKQKLLQVKAEDGTLRTIESRNPPVSSDGDQYRCVVCTCSGLTRVIRRQLFNFIHAADKSIRVVYLFIYPDDGTDIEVNENDPAVDPDLTSRILRPGIDVPITEANCLEIPGSVSFNCANPYSNIAYGGKFIKERMEVRARETGHYMGSNMLQSQLNLMQVPCNMFDFPPRMSIQAFANPYTQKLVRAINDQLVTDFTPQQLFSYGMADPNTKPGRVVLSQTGYPTTLYLAQPFALTPTKTPQEVVNEMISYLELEFFL